MGKGHLIEIITINVTCYQRQMGMALLQITGILMVLGRALVP
jgi:hypothetical protein